MSTAAPTQTAPQIIESRGGKLLRVIGNGNSHQCDIYADRADYIPFERVYSFESAVDGTVGVGIQLGKTRKLLERKPLELQIRIPENVSADPSFTHFAITYGSDGPVLAAAKLRANNEWYAATYYYAD